MTSQQGLSYLGRGEWSRVAATHPRRMATSASRPLFRGGAFLEGSRRLVAANRETRPCGGFLVSDCW